MMEYILIGILFALLLLWLLNIQSRITESNDEIRSINNYLNRKSEWEFSKYEVEQIKNFRGKEFELVNTTMLMPIMNRIEKLEEKNGQKN